MKFDNRENEKVTLPDGRVIFLSRSVAVVGCFVFMDSKEYRYYVPLVKRGKGVPDFKGYWCLPCGYLDWDESGTEGIVRELYEETGMNIYEAGLYHDYVSDSPYHDTHKISWQLKQPFHVNHYVDSNRQNVSLHFGAYIRMKDKPTENLFDLSVVDKGEAEEVIFQEIKIPPKELLLDFHQWFSSQDESFKEKKFAFGHEKLIYEFIKKSSLVRSL